MLEMVTKRSNGQKLSDSSTVKGQHVDDSVVKMKSTIRGLVQSIIPI